MISQAATTTRPVVQSLLAGTAISRIGIPTGADTDPADPKKLCCSASKRLTLHLRRTTLSQMESFQQPPREEASKWQGE